MKLLTVVVPCYNSQEYMGKCIDSLLPGGDAVEIIIVNDGSFDKTAEIAEEYAERFPQTIKVIHQKNGGHGEAVNTGLRHASSLYFKVVDSDDWFDVNAYNKVLDRLRQLTEEQSCVDMFISNFIYDKQGARKKKVMHYDKILPEGSIFGWNEVGNFPKGKYILMHSVIYRTKMLHECKLELPKHTFYVDNLFVYVPLPFVKKMYYLNEDLYHYYIGREDQSVNEKVMISRIDQQIKVNKLMVELVDLNRVANIKTRGYMLNYLEIITIISNILLIRSGTQESMGKKQELWGYIKDKDNHLYDLLRRGIMGRTVNLSSKTGQMISLAAYRISQKWIGFN